MSCLCYSVKSLLIITGLGVQLFYLSARALKKARHASENALSNFLGENFSINFNLLEELPKINDGQIKKT